MDRTKLIMAFKRNEPRIYIIAGVIGMTTATYTAIKATPKAVALREKKMAMLKEDSTKLEKAKAFTTSLTPYIPTAVLLASGACLIFAGDLKYLRRTAGLVNAYKVSQEGYSLLKESVDETVSESVSKTIGKKVSEKMDERHPENDISNIEHDDDMERFFDTFTGQKFWSRKTDIRDAISRATLEATENIFNPTVSFNTFVEYVNAKGFEESEAGDVAGWCITDSSRVPIEVTFTKDSKTDDLAWSISYSPCPEYMFNVYA